jgi:hypothetical protein
MMYCIGQVFLFANRVMKKKNIISSQRVLIELNNVQGLLVGFDVDRTYNTYTFAENDIILHSNFNPSENWATQIGVLKQIYRLLCAHLGIHTIKEATITRHLRRVLGKMHELRTRYPSGIDAFPFKEAFN